MSADTFLDTNLFIYQLEGDPGKADTANRIIREAVQQGNACISFQVVQETLNTAVRKAEVRLSATQMQAYLDEVLVPLWRVMPSAALYQRALALQDRHRYSFYDSLIIGAALEAGCTRLYSEDLQDGHAIEGLIIENPFA